MSRHPHRREQAALEAKEAAAGDGGVDWNQVVEDTLARAESDCPICFAPLQRGASAWGDDGAGWDDGGGDGGGEAEVVVCGAVEAEGGDRAPRGGGGMGLAWLDCSHCFHWVRMVLVLVLESSSLELTAVAYVVPQPHLSRPKPD